MTVKIGDSEIYRNITYIDTMSYKGCKEEKNKNKVAGVPFVLFAFYTVYCSGNSLKINITPYGESSTIQLIELKFKIWRVTFLRSFLTTQKL